VARAQRDRRIEPAGERAALQTCELGIPLLVVVAVDQVFEERIASQPRLPRVQNDG